MSITIEVDTVLHAAYIQLSESEVVRTIHYNDEIQIDLDEHGVAVGIEVLDESAPLPFTDLCDRFHVHSDVIDLLRLIRPDVNSYLAMTQGSDGVSSARSSSQLLPT